jgi:HlyD family secretion protein
VKAGQVIAVLDQEALRQAALERQYVRAPFDVQVIEILARQGERATQGIAEVGRTDRVYAIAEVYETDIGRVKLGQRARVESPALSGPLEGSVDRIGRKVGKLDAIGADPAARHPKATAPRA